MRVEAKLVDADADAGAGAGALPLPYVVGRSLTLKTSSGKKVLATITRVCSVTVSPVMEVVIRTMKGFEKYILKLYDRRFGVARKQQPYSPLNEAVWQTCVRSGLAKKVIQDLEDEDAEMIRARFKQDGEIEACDNAKEIDEDEDDDEDDDEDHELEEREAYKYYTSQQQLSEETRAYRTLADMQGSCIPTFIDTVSYTPADWPSDLPEKFFAVPGILLERIDGFPLSHITSQIPGQPLLWKEIIDKAVDVVTRVNKAGVIHLDCQPRNILVAEPNPGSFQPYLIDFAQSLFKEDYKDTEDIEDENGFKYIVTLNDNHRGIALLMAQRVQKETSHALHFSVLEPPC